MSDEKKSYSIIQGFGSDLSLNYNAENITIVKVLYQLDEAKKNKDLDSFEELVNISEAVFLQDKFSQLPLEDRMRFENLMGDHVDLKDRFYEFRNEVLDEHFPGIESEFEEYRGLFENARNEIYETKQLVENNEIKLEKFKAKEEYKLMRAQSREERIIKKSEQKEIRKTTRLEERIRKKNDKKYNKQLKRNNHNQINIGKRLLSGLVNLFDTDVEHFPETLKFAGRFVGPGSLTYLSLLAINHSTSSFMSDYNELIAGSVVGLVGGTVWNLLQYNYFDYR